MNSKSTKAKRKAIPTISLAELDRHEGVERFDHLMDPLDKWLAAEESKKEPEGSFDATS
jgi:hypothetical protein